MRYKFLLLILIAGIQGCSQGHEFHGIIFKKREYEKLHNLNKKDIESKFGKPQYISLKDHNKVYYLGYHVETFYIAPSNILERSLVEIIYNHDGQVLSVKKINVNPKDIRPDSDQEPNPDLGIDWKEMLAVGRVNA